MLSARCAARDLRRAKPAPLSRSKSQVARPKSQVVWAGNDCGAARRRRAGRYQTPLEPEVLAETPKPPVSAGALERARTAHDRAYGDFRTPLLAEADYGRKGARFRALLRASALLVDWNLRSYNITCSAGDDLNITPSSNSHARPCRLSGRRRSRPPPTSAPRRRRRRARSGPQPPTRGAPVAFPGPAAPARWRASFLAARASDADARLDDDLLAPMEQHGRLRL